MAPLVIRADAGAAVGTGHVMRCLALAQAWQDGGGRAAFVMAGGAGGLAPRLTSEDVDIEIIDAEPGSGEDTRRTIEQAARVGARWVVVDGYRFSGEYQRSIRDAGFRVLALDDYGHAQQYYADLVLNQNLHANEGLYLHREAYTRLLLGTEFTLLRREFASRCGGRRETPEVARKVLVTLGGSDPDNATLKVVEALRRLPSDGLEAAVLAGAANPHREELEAAAREAPGVRLLAQAGDMPGLMAWADVAVSAGGSTCWELAFMGLPALTLVLADNQRDIAAEMDRRGAARSLGRHEAATPEGLKKAVADLLWDRNARLAMSEAGRRLVDGEGAGRVVRAMAEAGS